MKSALLIAFIVAFFPSCGRNNNSCRSRENMRIECRAVNQPNYGYTYSQRMCDETYSADRCY
jgi:hypothetical protein